MYFFIVSLIILLSIFCTIYMVYKLVKQQDNFSALTFKQSIILASSGVTAFLADTVGVGSFAVNIAIAKTFKLVRDAELPGFVNGAQVIPGAIEAMFFLGVLHVDVVTLVVLVLGTTLGGFIGGIFASKIKTSTIRLIMIFAFTLVIFLLLGKLLGFLPIGGSLMKLTGIKLVLGFIGMFAAGFLVCFGVGLFALVQAILFLLGMSPLVAFPIMTTAGAIQQPVTTFAFTMNNAIPLKKALIVGIFGVIGVFIGFHVVTALSIEQLQWLLVVVIAYNTINLLNSYYKSKK
ncbi:sulfite exporter TauE/SafE family protein [Allofrancisella guangzhouensis]|nr:sulfite exporter TauE/SafE family protein [Allofrancisella guangzhouensis]MBK2043750.1 sulfite exporter TauE/SafE family protein [Allofrancisella guangzhouensis]MBK2045252.1 sulfite exporter TauE/SafE family protein [Allofrancisella guangzhouensis]MBK2045438.1 sulfite exporter TauE/SafE family protein [Allofrancisella guangzhouensis]